MELQDHAEGAVPEDRIMPQGYPGLRGFERHNVPRRIMQQLLHRALTIG